MVAAAFRTGPIPVVSDDDCLDFDRPVTRRLRNVPNPGYVNRTGPRWVRCTCPCTACDGACAFMVEAPVSGELYRCNGCAWSRLLREPSLLARMVAWIRAPHFGPVWRRWFR